MAQKEEVTGGGDAASEVDAIQKRNELLKSKLEIIEARAWALHQDIWDDDNQPFRDKLASLKLMTELVITFLNVRDRYTMKEDIESAQFYITQFDSLRYRVEELAERRREMGHEPRPGEARILR